MRLQDLAKQIDCIRCDQKKPAAGARRFHACQVCADCTQKLDQTPPPDRKTSAAR
jgi:hypothetical protein